MHMHLQDIFFQNHPTPPSEVKWSVPKKHCQIHAGSTKVTKSFENYQLKFIS